MQKNVIQKVSTTFWLKLLKVVVDVERDKSPSQFMTTKSYAKLDLTKWSSLRTPRDPYYSRKTTTMLALLPYIWKYSIYVFIKLVQVEVKDWIPLKLTYITIHLINNTKWFILDYIIFYCFTCILYFYYFIYIKCIMLFCVYTEDAKLILMKLEFIKNK